jgi:hypothetical protein
MEWKCQLMFNESTTGDDIQPVDLCDFLVPLKLTRKQNKLDKQRYPKSTNYMFPERFKARSGEMLLTVELKLAGIKSGITIVKRSSNSPPPSAGTDRAFTITFQCDHGRLFSANKPVSATGNNEIKRAYKSTTKRPVDPKHICSFGFRVFLQKESAEKFPGRWFLSTLSSTKCGNHNAHSHHFKLPPDCMHVPIQLMTDEEKKLAKDCSQLCIQTSSTAALLTLRAKTGLNWKINQVTHLGTQRKKLLAGVSSDATSAERLIQSFESR